jgi:hypothetical protein
MYSTCVSTFAPFVILNLACNVGTSETRLGVMMEERQRVMYFPNVFSPVLYISISLKFICFGRRPKYAFAKPVTSLSHILFFL